MRNQNIRKHETGNRKINAMYFHKGGCVQRSYNAWTTCLQFTTVIHSCGSGRWAWVQLVVIVHKMYSAYTHLSTQLVGSFNSLANNFIPIIHHTNNKGNKLLKGILL